MQRILGIILLIQIFACKSKINEQNAILNDRVPQKPVSFKDTSSLHFDTLVVLSSTMSVKEKLQGITKNIKRLRGYIYQPHDSQYYDSLDTEKLSDETANQIVQLITENNVDISHIGGLIKNATYNEELKIYSLGFDCGGTRRFISYPIIQYSHGKKKIAYNFSTDINCQFKKIVNLGNDLFLLTGYESGSGACYQSIAYVIQIKNNTINTSYPAFVKRPYLNFCNGAFSFNLKNNTLQFRMDKFSSPENIQDELLQSDHYARDTLSAMKLYNWISEEYYDKRKFHLRFNGKAFVENTRN